MKREDGRKYFYQWELDQRLIVTEDCTIVQFGNGTLTNALGCEVYTEDGIRYADVPNILLQTAADLHAYAWDEETASVVAHCVFGVEPMPKPAQYAYTQTEVKQYDVLWDTLTVLQRGEGVDSIVRRVMDAAEKPLAQPTATGESAISLGRYCKVPGKNAMAVNYNNQVDGTYGFAANNGNIVGPDAGASSAFGSHNKIYAFASFVAGRLNQITQESTHAFAAGLGNFLSVPYGVVFGKYNDKLSKALFAIGNGKSNSIRSNAFEVFEDGSMALNGVTFTASELRNTIDNVGEFTVAELRQTVDNVAKFTPEELRKTVDAVNQFTAAELRETINKAARVSPIMLSAAGKTVQVSAPLLLQALTLYGKTTQSGTASKNSPVAPVSIGDDGCVDISVKAGGADGAVALRVPTPGGLKGIPAVRKLVYNFESGDSIIYGGNKGSGDDSYDENGNLLYDYEPLVSGDTFPKNGEDFFVWTYLGCSQADPWVNRSYLQGNIGAPRRYYAIRLGNIRAAGKYSLKFTVGYGSVATVGVRVLPGDTVAEDIAGMHIPSCGTGAVGTIVPYSQASESTLSVTIKESDIVDGSIVLLFRGGYGDPGNFRCKKLVMTQDVAAGNYIDADGKHWICDEAHLIQRMRNQRIGRIDSYNGEDVGDIYLSSTGELSKGAVVLYPLETPVESSLEDLYKSAVISFGGGVDGQRISSGYETDTWSVPCIFWKTTHDSAYLQGHTFTSGKFFAVEIKNIGNPGVFEMEINIPKDLKQAGAEVYYLAEAPEDGWSSTTAAAYTPDSPEFLGILDCADSQKYKLAFRRAVSESFYLLFKGTELDTNTRGNLRLLSLSMEQLDVAACIEGEASASVDAEGAGISVSYATDIKTYIDNKFAELSAALVNNV